MAQRTKAGIDDMVAYLPQLYLSIADLAEARQLEYAKLNKGLGLTAMSIPDVHEDAATMTANAIRQLIEQNGLHPQAIGRIYLGTESALDGAKPMATYALDMLTQYFAPQHGEDCFLNCDVVDLTFACVAAVDAMQNTLDWIRGGTGRIGIVVGADIAKYELNSGGEYTQGAGAVAVLLKENPRLLAFQEEWGVATRPEHDFFKPVRTVTKKDLLQELLALDPNATLDMQTIMAAALESMEVNGTLDSNEATLVFHKDTPVFDGPYSNQCYQQRIREALNHFQRQNQTGVNEPLTDNWRRLVFHLPYAYQARRMFSEVFLQEAKMRGDYADLISEIGQAEPDQKHFTSIESYREAQGKFLSVLTKTERYRRFVAEKIEKGERASSQVGNLYTASLFLSLMSTLESDWQDNTALEGSRLGFFGYGSGSKSKVFTGEVQPQWREVVERFQLFNTLQTRQQLDYSTYEQWHRGLLTESILPPQGEFFLAGVNTEKGVAEGARQYAWQPQGATAPVEQTTAR
ncbi:MAG: hydroxymethylglutaryl-CoA synthase family protein [Lewinellaceae bacterium]|nr:hydroxymethylglutaryl-CoA synthase family protein [Lewinellaceae bacterium]